MKKLILRLFVASCFFLSCSDTEIAENLTTNQSDLVIAKYSKTDTYDVILDKIKNNEDVISQRLYLLGNEDKSVDEILENIGDIEFEKLIINSPYA